MKSGKIVGIEYTETIKLLDKYKLRFNDAWVQCHNNHVINFSGDVYLDNVRIGSFGSSKVSPNGLSFRDDYSKNEDDVIANKTTWKMLINKITKEIFPNYIAAIKRDRVLFALAAILEDKYFLEESEDAMILRIFKTGEKNVIPNGTAYTAPVKRDSPKARIIEFFNEASKDNPTFEEYEIMNYHFDNHLDWQFFSPKESFNQQKLK